MKMIQRTEHRERCHATEGTQRTAQHGLAQVAQQNFIALALGCIAGNHAIDHLDPAYRADTARCALAAGFDRAEFHRIARLRCHVDAVVEHHDATMAEHAADRDERLIVDRRVQLRYGYVGAERATHLYRAHRSTTRGTAAVILD